MAQLSHASGAEMASLRTNILPMTTPNAVEIAYWNADAGSRWAAFQDRIDRAFAVFTREALAFADLRAGDHVLDIGCGCGATSLELGAAVGETGSVVGVDVSVPMLAVADARASASGLGNVRFIHADASTEAFDDARFDLVFSRFGVMFFDDPLAAFSNIRRAVKGGRLTFVCWRELAANPWFSVPANAVRPHVPPQPKPDPLAPGPLAFADAERVRGILEGAGFEDVRFEPFDVPIALGTRAEALELLSEIGPASRLLAEADDDARDAALLALDRALAGHERHGEVMLDGGVWIFRAGSRAH
jgi:SAM-dependent methyltransferase